MSFATRGNWAGILLLACAAGANPAWAQNAGEDALKESEDAFGTHVGLESTGIYTEYDTRGFSPLDAGNVRIDGIYFDQVANLASRLRQTTAIRVGFGAVDTPFVAPTGIVDHRMRSFPDKPGNSLIYNRFYYGGYFNEWEYRLPLDEHFAIRGGVAAANIGQSDGADGNSHAFTAMPIFRAKGMEFTAYLTAGAYNRDETKPLAVVTDGYLPKVPPSRRYLGQDWAAGKKKFTNYGAMLKSRITDHLSFRGGMFKSIGDKAENFTEVFSIKAANGLSSHYVIADPSHDIRSTSGEGMFVWRFGGNRNVHRLFAGYRARRRVTETGGSEYFTLDDVIHGQIDRVPEPQFEFGAVDSGLVRQSAYLLAYVGMLDGIGHINLGLQKARYRASLTDGVTGVADRRKADPWLYNAALMIPITSSFSAYVATQKGLEDSGIAPSNAANRDVQLPAAKSTQYEGGLRWDFGKGQLVLAAFEITKPYFSYDADRNFVILGDQRHRGLEVSLASHFTDRFDMLVGTILMDPTVTGPGREARLLGKRPAGMAKVYGRLDANYRTDLPGGLTFTSTVEFQGARAATAAPIEQLGGKQLTVKSNVMVDLGTRQLFHIGETNVAMRLLVRNIFDTAAWHVPSPDVLLPKHRRSVLFVTSVDF